jgi:hypothetical protein
MTRPSTNVRFVTNSTTNAPEMDKVVRNRRGTSGQKSKANHSHLGESSLKRADPTVRRLYGSPAVQRVGAVLASRSPEDSGGSSCAGPRCNLSELLCAG